MTHFQNLLKPDLDSTPQADQRRAALLLPDMVKESRLRWWTKSPEATMMGSLLVILIAPYSQYDLAMLDILDDELSRRWPKEDGQPIPVYVANLQQYQTVEQLTNDFSVITRAPLQTPVTIVRESGEWRKNASGKHARDLAATTLGMDSDDFNERVIQRVPTYSPSA